MDIEANTIKASRFECWACGTKVYGTNGCRESGMIFLTQDTITIKCLTPRKWTYRTCASRITEIGAIQLWNNRERNLLLLRFWGKLLKLEVGGKEELLDWVNALLWMAQRKSLMYRFSCLFKPRAAAAQTEK